MRRFSFAAALLLTAGITTGSAVAAPPHANPAWPSVDQQLAKDKVQRGSALEHLILANQNFDMLRAEEATDKIPVPPWLRVAWRKNHPEGTYTGDDPTGGYPHVLKEMHEWMLSHQDLAPNLADAWQAAVAEVDDADYAVMTDATTVGADRRVSGAQTVPRSESDIRIDYWNASRVIAGSNNIGGSGQQAMYFSNDGGLSWGQTFLPLFSTDQYHSDPTVEWRSNGSAWSTTLGIKGFNLKLRAYTSANGGSTWTYDNTASAKQSAVDKQMTWVDHSATSPYKDTLYVCWHNNAPQFVNRRTASAWSTPIQISSTESTGTAIGCDVKSNANGDAFVFWPTTGNRRIVMSKSTNGGTSWGNPKVVVATTFDSYDIGVPAFNSRRILIYASGGAYRTATKNLVYASWTDLTGAVGCNTAANEPGANAASTCKSRIWFARSTDGGATWGAPFMINNQVTLNDQFNQWMGVDETTGRLAIMYYDTVGDATRKKTHVYYQTSTDDGTTWSAPVQVTTGQTDETIAGADSGNQYGDYNGLSIHAGKIFPVWTDRRSGGKEEIWTAPISEP
ncbi:MAG TPA: sialidase family protein [Thermoanaerobaculia bacterium]|nr:sialidase family protein [Thermoanaerobaculia bacterium]